MEWMMEKDSLNVIHLFNFYISITTEDDFKNFIIFLSKIENLQNLTISDLQIKDNIIFKEVHLYTKFEDLVLEHPQKMNFRLQNNSSYLQSHIAKIKTFKYISEVDLTDLNNNALESDLIINNGFLTVKEDNISILKTGKYSVRRLTLFTEESEESKYNIEFNDILKKSLEEIVIWCGPELYIKENLDI
mmetsp:Transcript_4779/g.4030  ORF Transcript_4779/g.4030 Transcript_4779/m.4030 type:complete len:189 (+) Transcript_4779:205-771(+)